MAKVRSELKSTGYEIFIGALSVLSIVNLVLVYAFVKDEGLQTVLSVMNGLFSAIFLGDFIYRLATAPSRGAYFFKQYGWADLLASLPFPQFKILRVFRLIRVFRLLRDLGPRAIWRTLVLADVEPRSPAQVGVQGASSDAEGVMLRAATMDDLRALLAESESKLTEMRLLLAGPESAKDGAGPP